jgi:glycosyltransferase involved in cell wall biosynthesis
MHVVYVGYGYDARLRCEAELLQCCPTIPAFAAALTAAGSTVTVMQRFSRDASMQIAGASMRFRRDRLPARLRWQIPWRFHRSICELAASASDAVIHVNGLIFPAQIYALRKQLPSSIPIVVQHHAERPCFGLKRALQRCGLRAADAFFFTSSTLAEVWVANGVLSPRQHVYEVMESPVTIGSCNGTARRLRGSPVFLWVGRLNPGKDPLAVLAAFEHAVRQVSSARLYMIYAGGDLLEAVRERVVTSEALRSSVKLIGEVPHNDLSSFYASSDFFLSGSHYEGSGYALAEAMAHAVVPILPRIASFSAMANNAARFWSPGDASDCARALMDAMAEPVGLQRERVRTQYREFLSSEAIARRAMAAYAQAIDLRRSRS